MKIALTLSGQPRRYKMGFKQLKKWFLDRYDIDVYLHSWIDTKFYKFHYDEIQREYDITTSVYDELLELYQPKDHLFETPINFDNSNFLNFQRINSQWGMFFSLKRAWELLENSGVKYDYVIRARYDLFFDHFLRLDNPLINDISQLDPAKIHYPTRVRDINSDMTVNDIFAIGGYNAMKVYHNIFPNLVYYLFLDKDYDKALGENKYYNEAILLWHLKQYHIQRQSHQDFKPINLDGVKILR